MFDVFSTLYWFMSLSILILVLLLLINFDFHHAALDCDALDCEYPFDLLAAL